MFLGLRSVVYPVAALEDRENRQVYMDKFFVTGVYEYVTARTHLFDAFFREALTGDFEQIVLLGAGYDSRALRFQGDLGPVPVFEVDAPRTQERKRACLAAAGPMPLPVPPWPLTSSSCGRAYSRPTG